MSKSMMITEEVMFKANSNEVWQLLTNPEMTKLYMFGCEVLSDWKINSPVLWKGKTENGEEITYVKGKVQEYEDGKKVTFTMFDPNIGLPDIPRNYIKLSYEVFPHKTGSKLIITQGDFQHTDHSEKRFAESKQGWEFVIPSMKKILNE